MATLPNLIDRIRALIAAPSISSVNPDWDQGNNNVINLLASWLEDLGYQIDIQPITDKPGKSNLIATPWARTERTRAGWSHRHSTL